MQNKDLQVREVDLETALRILTGLSSSDLQALKQANKQVEQQLTTIATVHQRAYTVIQDPNVSGSIIALHVAETK